MKKKNKKIEISLYNIIIIIDFIIYSYLTITSLISSTFISAIVTFDFGWKHITLHVPRAASIWNNSSFDFDGEGTVSSSAGKSLTNVNVFW